MKIKEGFMLREIAGSWIVVPLSNRVVELNGIMSLSESGALIWRKLEKGAEVKDLIDLIRSEYNVDSNTAAADVDEFISAIGSKGLIEK
ncbi:MAG: PqqD family protein [Clostridiaceae bacterium]